jgi:hypothetical protein
MPSPKREAQPNLGQSSQLQIGPRLLGLVRRSVFQHWWSRIVVGFVARISLWVRPSNGTRNGGSLSGSLGESTHRTSRRWLDWFRFRGQSPGSHCEGNRPLPPSTNTSYRRTPLDAHLVGLARGLARLVKIGTGTGLRPKTRTSEE